MTPPSSVGPTVNKEEHLRRIENICETYRTIVNNDDTIVLGTDEKSGVITYFNLHLAKPYKWTYEEKALKV